MPLYTVTSKDWANPEQPHPYAVNLDVGINEYTFGRTTPDNKFVVSTGLVNDDYGIRMTGAGLTKKTKKPVVKKPVDKKPVVKKPVAKKPVVKKPVTKK